MFASPRIYSFVFALFLLLLTTSDTSGQTSRTITKADENKIKQEVRQLIENLEAEYDLFLSESALQRRSRLAALITPGAGRVFYNDKVIIENDFYDAEVKGLEKSERDKRVEDYFNELSDKFGAHDNGDDPNQGKQVKINLTKVSKVQAISDTDSMYIKVAFEVNYDGKARNGYQFKAVERVAELRLEREGRNWRPYITAIRFLDPEASIENKSRTVGIVEQILGVDIKFADVINTPDIKNVSRNPVLLKAFLDNELWGLLIDEDNDKRVLVQPIFCEINEFIDNRSLVCLDGKWGCIDKSGKIVIDCVYDLPFSFVKGRAQVQLGGRSMFIDLNGKATK